MKKYDLIVAGGGMSGVAAAISAARAGLSVLIFDKSNCFGGAAVNCLVQPFMPYVTTVDSKNIKLTQGVFKEIGEKLAERNSFEPRTHKRGYDTYFHDEYLKLVLNRMVAGSGAEILFHANLVGATAENGKVKTVTVSCKGILYEFASDYFIDATGDASLAYMSGCSFRLGRSQDNLCQPMTLCFRLINVETEKVNRKEINEKYQTLKAEGKITNPREDVLIFPSLLDGVLHFNTTRIVKLNPTDIFDITKAEIQAREQVFEIYDFLKSNFEAFKNSELIMTANEIGVRESRMIDGEYVLTGQDLLQMKRFDDTIALGNYDIDIHNPEGTGTSHHYFSSGEYYNIPYRCLIPKGFDNLLVAGRCISVDHEAQASIRVMNIVCSIGHACGEAVALAFETNSNTKDIDVKILQKNLIKHGAIINV